MNSTRFIKENEISEIIKKDNNCSAHFQWSHTHRYLTLDLITFNPEHKNYFLLHSICKEAEDNHSNTYVEILNKMIEYIKEKQKTNFNYTIEWNYKDTNESIKNSYFSGQDMTQILNKFFYGKDISSIVIYTINMIAES